MWGKKIKSLLKKVKTKKAQKQGKKTKKKHVHPKKSFIEVKKVTHNPIISPKHDSHWEAFQTFNPAAILIDDKVHFLYRAIGHDGISRFGYANSHDGINLHDRHHAPAYQDSGYSGPINFAAYASGGSFSGCEDPRIVRVEDEDLLYITYTSCTSGLRVGLSSIKVEDFVNKRWKWSRPKLISPPGEVHKNWVIFPEKINGKYAILHSLSPKIKIEYLDSLEFEEDDHIESHYSPSKKTENWDSFLRGPGAPPIKTEHGWLLFYHAMNHEDMGKYKVGAMLLDLKDPKKILHRSKVPILVPEECYEMDGFKAGVVYLLGAVVKNKELLLYYGGADSYVCVAHTSFSSFIKKLINH